MSPAPLRLLVAEDSPIFATLLEQLIAREPDLELVSLVQDGQAAVRACRELRPDLVLMDVQMPRMDGLAATEAIMAEAPTPILIITADPFHNGVDISFRALSAGALDLFAKETLRLHDPSSHEELLRKIRLLAQIPVIRHVRGNRRDLGSSSHSHTSPPLQNPERAAHAALNRRSTPLIGIVASTGGPKALARILASLPASLPASLLIVQHITRGFTEHLARWLDANCPLRVQLARERDTPRPGVVYIAPSDAHLALDASRLLRLRDAPPVNGHTPSGDVLLESLAEHDVRGVLGVILSGMGSDGARGMLAMHQAGATTFAQDAESSVVWGMPRAACELGAVTEIIALDQLATRISERADLMARRAAR